MITDCKTSYIPELELPDKKHTIKPNDIIILNRFSTEKWIVCFGWFSFDGNRKLNGWYLKSFDDYKITKPLLDVDLFDIYFVESNEVPTPTPDIPEPEPFNLYCVYNTELNTLTYYNSDLHDDDFVEIEEDDTHIIIYLDSWNNLIPESLDETLIQSIEVADRITPTFPTLNHALFGCTNLTSANLSNLNVSQILDFSCMFKNCENLIEVDIHNWITNNALSFDSMFMDCSNLTSINGQFNTDKTFNVDNMFNGCINLEFDASNFNVDSIVSHVDFNTNSKVIAPEWKDEIGEPGTDVEPDNGDGTDNGDVDSGNEDSDVDSGTEDSDETIPSN